ncbi:MAG: FtsX-like permease family protein [Candidatus Hodarchaeota archaeon]
MTMITSVLYAIKSIRRNFRRTFTLMFGVIMSLTIVSGVLFYVDSTSGELIEAVLDDIHIDLAISDTSLTEAEAKSLQEFVQLNTSDLITSVEIIAGTKPFGPNTVGAIVAADNQYNLPTDDLRTIFTSEQNFTTTYIFGIEPSYLETFSIFSTIDNITEIFENDQVLISRSINEYFKDDTDNILNLSLVSFEIDISTMPPTPNLGIPLSVELNVGGIVNVDTAAMEEVSYAFEPESLLESNPFGMFLAYTQVTNCIIMSYSNYVEMISQATNAICLNGVHVKIEHSKFASDPTNIYSKLSGISTLISTWFPETTIIDLLGLALDQVADQLNQMRLFLIYFALPGLFLGAYISKYAIDLTIEERQREIGILRIKSALRKYIATVICIESLTITGIGLTIGIITGYLASMTISKLFNSGSTGFITVSLDSLVISASIGGLIVFIAAFLSVRQLLAPSITETLKEGKERHPTLWRRIYLDLILIGIVIIVTILNILEFNPIPGFAITIYDFIAPLLTWIGLTLLMIRILERILTWLQVPISKIYHLIFKDLADLITRNILYKPQRITKITIVLSLTLSFGLVISTINESYQQGVRDDALYQVGADLRIQFPSKDYIDYNTSDFITDLSSYFNEEIAGSTAIYYTTIRLGRQQVLTVGIEPETFFDVAMVKNSFFQSNNYKNTEDILTATSSSSYTNVVISTGIATPESTFPSSSRIGGQKPEGFNIEIQTFSIGDELPIGKNSIEVVEIVDIVAHFPAIADLTGLAEEGLRYLICNIEFLTNPTPISNTTFITNDNASYLLVDIDDDYDPQEIESEIFEWYELNYPESVELSIVNVDEYYESYDNLITSLTGLTSMEFILVLTVSTLGLEIFLTSSLYERKKEFGTYYAIGGLVNDVRKLILGELSLITGFSLLTGTLLSVLISYMYIGFISDLLILELYSLTIPIESILALTSLVIIAMIISILLAGRKLSRLDPVNILRTV